MRSGAFFFFFLPPRIRKETINKQFPNAILDDGSYTFIFKDIFPGKKIFCVYLSEIQYLLLGNNLI